MLEEKWNDHKLTLVMVRDILMYLDRTYVHHSQPKKKPVYDLGLSMFRSHVWSAPRVSSRAKMIVLHNVFLERSGLIIDRSVMKGITTMLVEIGVDGSNCYERDFQRGFLEETREFYKKESEEFLQKNTVPEYVRKATSRLKEEEQRVRNYLSATTEAPLLEICEQVRESLRV